jgi:hypothetical protein
MIIKRKTLYLDISQPKTENIHVNAQDINSRFYKIYLSNNGERINLSSDFVITPYVNNSVVGTCEINSDGSFNFDLSELDCCHCLLQFRIETKDDGIFHTNLINVSVGYTIN